MNTEEALEYAAYVSTHAGLPEFLTKHLGREEVSRFVVTASVVIIATTVTELRFRQYCADLILCVKATRGDELGEYHPLNVYVPNPGNSSWSKATMMRIRGGADPVDVPTTLTPAPVIGAAFDSEKA